MDEKILKALRAAKQRLVQLNDTLRPGSLGRSKNDEAISLIDEVLPKEKAIVPNSYNSELVYPHR